MLFKFQDVLGKYQPYLCSPQVWRIALLVGVGIFLMVFAGSWLNPRPVPQTSETSLKASGNGFKQKNGLGTVEKELEARLEQILSAVAGAGRVQVTVILDSGPEHIYAQDVSKEKKTIEEKDQVGGTRTTAEVNERGNLVLVQEGSRGREEPVIVKTIRPKIAGVLVLAEGARSPELREKLTHAVETVLAVPPHKVKVLPKESW